MKFFANIIILIVLLTTIVTAQTKNVGIGTTTPDASAILDLSVASSATKMGLLIPRMTTAERDVIVTPATGLLIYNTTISKFQYFNGTIWIDLLTTAVTSLNGLTGATQTFITSTTGTDFTISSAGTVHTFNIPDASAANRGLVTIGAQTIAGAKTLTGSLTFSGTVPDIITGANENLSIMPNGTGNVGIGTTTPGQKLTIEGTLGIIETGTGANFHTIFQGGDQAGDITYTLPIAYPTTNGQVLSSTTLGVLSWVTGGGGGSSAISSLTNAASTNTIDNLNHSQTWNWSTANNQSALSLAANTITSGTILDISSSNTSLNSTEGLLRVVNSGTSTSGMIFRAQSNSTTGAGLTVLASGNVGIGTIAPAQKLTVAGTLGILETGTSPQYHTIFQGGDQAADITYTLPIAVGANGQVLTTDITGVLSWATPSATSGWNITGNSGTDPATNFLGTIDDKAIIFKVNNQKAGILSSADNTAFGYQAFNVNTTGTQNSAFGFKALSQNKAGTSNTGIGFQALYSNTTVGALSGKDNVAVGWQALFANTTGSNNTAIGQLAGRYSDVSTANETSSNSVYLGSKTKASASGNANEIVIGYDALGSGSNTITLGNTSIVTSVMRGTVRYSGATSGYVGITSPATVATPYTLTLPDAAPTVNGQVLSATTAGVLSWATGGGGGLSGSGTANYVARWTPNTTTLGIGIIQDNATTVGINNAPDATYRLLATGTSITAIAGTYNGTILGLLGTSAYGAYGQWTTTRLGYLGSASYGAYGQFDANHYGYLGAGTAGVYGVNSGTAATEYGVQGEVSGTGATSKFGGWFSNSSTSSILQYGAYGTTSGNTSTGTKYGIYGTATGTAATNYGVYGTASDATTNWAGYFAGNVKITGSVSLAIKTTTSNSYPAAVDDYTILVNVDSGTIDLPQASTCTGKVYNIKKIYNGTGTITIDPYNAELIDGASTNTVIATQWAGLTIQCDGSAWYVISNKN